MLSRTLATRILIAALGKTDAMRCATDTAGDRPTLFGRIIFRKN